MYKKIIMLVLTICFIFTVPMYNVQAEENNATTVKVLENEYVGNGKLKLTVECYIGDDSLINDQLKLSYHVWNEDKTEYISYENLRIPICTDGNRDNIVEFDVAFDKPKTSAWICFDIVDEKNGFWYAGSPGVNFQSEDVFYTYSHIDNLKTICKVNFSKNAVCLSANILVFVAAIALVIFVKKKEIL